MGVILMVKTILDFLNNNADGIQAIFAILLFLATLIYVFINTAMHKEMVKTRESDERPEIN